MHYISNLFFTKKSACDYICCHAILLSYVSNEGFYKELGMNDISKKITQKKLDYYNSGKER